MVPHSEKPSKRWKPLNTENTPVHSVERSVTEQPRSILGVVCMCVGGGGVSEIE